jgi:hypothetical protein
MISWGVFQNWSLAIRIRLHEADELIVGLPVSAYGSETLQSNKVRSVVGRLAVQAAKRCVTCMMCSYNFKFEFLWLCSHVGRIGLLCGLVIFECLSGFV